MNRTLWVWMPPTSCLCSLRKVVFVLFFDPVCKMVIMTGATTWQVFLLLKSYYPAIFLRQLLPSILYNLTIYCVYCLFLSLLTACQVLKRRTYYAWVMGGIQAIPVPRWIKYWRLRESERGNMGARKRVKFSIFLTRPHDPAVTGLTRYNKLKNTASAVML